MAAFREHITVSGILGVGFGVVAWSCLGYSPAEAAVSGVLTGIGGMIPDLDSPHARPGQEIFALTAAVAPLVLVGHILKYSRLPVNTEVMILIMISVYALIRYGLSGMVARFSVHRGMFHSIPGMLIAAEIIYVAYPNPLPIVKLLMGSGMAIGFFSHLLLDEIYSINWDSHLPKLKKSFGTAIKFASPSLGPTVFTYCLLLILTFMIGEQTGIIGPPIDENSTRIAEGQHSLEKTTATAPVVKEAALSSDKLTDAPPFR